MFAASSDDIYFLISAVFAYQKARLYLKYSTVKLGIPLIPMQYVGGEKNGYLRWLILLYLRLDYEITKSRGYYMSAKIGRNA